MKSLVYFYNDIRIVNCIISRLNNTFEHIGAVVYDRTGEQAPEQAYSHSFTPGNIVLVIKPLHNRAHSSVQDVREDVGHPNVG